jgi:hypothetical protein
VETFGQQGNVLVREGQFTTVSLNMQSFVPQFTGVPEQVPAGQDFTVEWNAVPGATSYDVAIANSPDFESGTVLQSLNTESTELTLALDDGGSHYFRVRARNEFNSLGLFSPVSAGVMVLVEPPTVESHTLEFTPATPQSCPETAQAFAMIERVGYSDPGGNFPSSDFTETGERIESQLRDQGDADWEPVIAANPGRDWTVLDGSDGSSGELASGICFRGRDEADFIDFRVRLIASGGAASEWNEMRLWLPKTVDLSESPETRNLPPGQTVQLVATATDVNGDVVPGDAITWSNFNPEVGVVDADGVYAVATSGSGGLDRAYARAGHAWESKGVEADGPAAGEEWWAPCWVFPALTMGDGDFLVRRMHVYPDGQYVFQLMDPQDGSMPDGDADLYLRRGAPVTTDEYDDGSFALEHIERVEYPNPEVSYQLPGDVVWFGIYAFTPIQNVRFEVTTPDERCGYPGNGIDPATMSPGAAPALAVPLPAAVAPPVSYAAPPPLLRPGTRSPDGAPVPVDMGGGSR